MKKFKVLFVPGLVVVMCLALFAQEPQGRGGQGAPLPTVLPAARGGQVPALPVRARPACPVARLVQGWQRRRSRRREREAVGAAAKTSRFSAERDLPNTMQAFVQALGLLEKGTCSLLPRRGPVLRRKEAEAGRPQNDHHDACNQRHLPGRPAARDLLHLPPGRHKTVNDAPVLKRSGRGVARSQFGLLRGSRAGRRRFRSNSPRLSSMPASKIRSRPPPPCLRRSRYCWLSNRRIHAPGLAPLSGDHKSLAARNDWV